MSTSSDVTLWPVPGNLSPVDTLLRSGGSAVTSPAFSVNWTTTSSIPASLTFTRASAATYYNSSGVRTSAATDVPRIEYNPNTLVQQGLLIEEQRSNILKDSGDQTTANWSTAQISRTTSSTLGADNTTFMTLATAAINAGGHFAELFNTTAVTTVASTNYAFSIDFKKTNYNYVWACFQSNTSGAWVTLVVDLSSNTVTQTSTGGTSGTIVGTPTVTPLTNSIVRLEFIASHSGVTGYLVVGFAQGATGNTFLAAGGDLNNFTSPAGTETFLVNAAQMSLGSVPTSYIPTTSAAVTRSADLLSSTDAGLLSAKGWVVEVGELDAATASTILGINAVIGIGVDSTDHLTTADGGTQTTANTGTWTGQNRGGIAWDSTPRVSIDLDGGTVVTAANSPATPTALYFGATNNGAGAFINGHIRMMAGYTALTDAQLPIVTVVGASFGTGGYTSYTLALDTAAYVLTGSDATVFATRNLNGVSGIYALTGTAAAVFATRNLAEASGAYVLTGSAASVFATRKLAAVVGTYALTGHTATAFATRKLSAATGAYAFTGQTATLIRKYVLSETSGSYALTGSTATVRVQLSMTATSGSYFLTGSSAPLKLTIKLPLTSGAYTLSGSASATFATHKLSAVTGSYILTGSVSTTIVTRKLAAVSGSYALTGSAAQAFATRKLAGVTGAYFISGQAATLTLVQSGSVSMTADTGSYALTGSSATLVATFISPTGIYTVSGGQVVDHLPLQDGVEVVRAVSFPGSTTQRQTAD